MTEGTVVSMKNVSVLYQVPAKDYEIVEPAVILRLYDGKETFGIIQGENEITINPTSLPLLMKELRKWHKIAMEEE